ncbi:MAG: hypothetical protein R2734_20825 [Nocardioides sp.]
MAHLDFVVPTDLTRWAAADCFTVHMTTSGQARVHIQGEEHLLSPFFALVVSPGMSYRLHFEQDSPADRAHRTAGPGAAAVPYARPLAARADHLRPGRRPHHQRRGPLERRTQHPVRRGDGRGLPDPAGRRRRGAGGAAAVDAAVRPALQLRRGA